MKHTAILGAQWGDEGKGKLVDLLSAEHNIVVRCQGGPNAGHTVVIGDQKYAFHLLPSAVTRPEITCVLGNGMVIDPMILDKELEQLKSRIPNHAQIYISNRAHVITPQLIQEENNRPNTIGTTGKGIGPTYRDKIMRNGMRMFEFLESDLFSSELKERLEPMVIDTSEFLESQLGWSRFLFEGAQGAMLDIDNGTYPYVTSSNTTIGGLFTGSGIYVKDLEIIGVAKAYTTRVGNGPFPTELNSDLGELLRNKGHEFGTTTGRPRRCGWLDLVALQHAKRINGLDSLAITKLDVLTGIDPIMVCIGYEIDNSELSAFPADLKRLDLVKPIYKQFSGWTEDITSCRKPSELPTNAKKLINHIEEDVNVPVLYIGVGPARDQIIIRDYPIKNF